MEMLTYVSYFLLCCNFRALEAWGAKGGLPSTFGLLMFFIINDNEKKMKKCNILKTEIQYRLYKKSLSKTII